MSAKKTILVVEDERIVALDLKRSLEDLGYVVYTAASGDAAIELAAQANPNLALMDIRIEGDKDGIETATILRKRFDIPAIYLTAHVDEETLSRAKLTEPYGYLTKPVKIAELKSTVEIGLYKHEIDQRRVERYRWLLAMLNSLTDGVISVNNTGLVAYLNPAAEALTGTKAEMALGYPIDEVLLLVSEKTQIEAPRVLKQVMDSGIASGSRDAELRNAATGSTHFIIYNVAPIFSDLGSTLGAVILMLHDVTPQITLQRQLESANKELDAFSYSVSHDLRAPLRTIEGFSQVVIEEYGNKLDDLGRDYLRRIGGATQRMTGLIEDLLELSRITRASVVRSQVDLSALARRVLNVLAEGDSSRIVEQHVADGMIVSADPRLCEIVFENLIGNAWKYTAKTEGARIDVGEMMQEGQRVFCVRDNGAGFDATQAYRLFEPFQRLHTVAEFQGSGIGLTIVQRIISRHGGHIWAEGHVGAGAAFCFTLGKT